jgi:predicted CoA-binding protein
MALQDLSLETIEDFLAQKRIAMVGVSREPGSFSVTLFKELCRRGFNVVPVNPKTPELLGWRCFARVQDIQPPVEAALLMTSPKVTETVVHDCPRPASGAFGCTEPGDREPPALRRSSSAASAGFA